MPVRLQGYIGLISAQTLLGTIGLCVLESGADPVSVAFYRCAIGGVMLTLYCGWRGDLVTIAHLTPKTLFLAIASGILMTANWVLFFEGIHRTGIAVATILFHIQPFFVVALGAIIFLERLHPVALLWICLALVGLTLSSGLTGDDLSGNPSALIGIACTLVAAFFYALVTVIAKGLSGIKPPQLALVQCGCGVLMLFAATPLAPDLFGSTQWIWLTVIGIVHTGGVYVILYNALPKLSTPVIAVLLFLYPASAIVVDALAYGHLISVPQLSGLLLIIIASLGVTLKWGMRDRQLTPT